MSAHPGERLSAFLDGELSPAERAEVETHLRDCAECARRLEEMATVDALARALPVSAPAGYFDALPGRVRARVRRRPRIAPMAIWAAAAAAALMFVVVAPLTLRHEGAIVAPAAQKAPPASAIAAEPQAVRPATTLPAEAPTAAAPEAFAKRERASRPGERDRADKRAPALMGAPLPSPLPAPTAAPRKAAADAVAPAAPPGPPAVDGFAAARPGTRAQAEGRAEVAATADAAGEPPREDAPKQTAEAPRASTPARERKAAVGGRVFSHPDRALPADERYEALLSRRAATAGAARALRDAWEAFARDLAADPRADEARVRAIEAGAAAWRLGGDPADLALVRARARAYLEAEGAPQRERVRAVLDALPPSP